MIPHSIFSRISNLCVAFRFSEIVFEPPSFWLALEDFFLLDFFDAIGRSNNLVQWEILMISDQRRFGNDRKINPCHGKTREQPANCY